MAGLTPSASRAYPGWPKLSDTNSGRSAGAPATESRARGVREPAGLKAQAGRRGPVARGPDGRVVVASIARPGPYAAVAQIDRGVAVDDQAAVQPQPAQREAQARATAARHQGAGQARDLSAQR